MAVVEASHLYKVFGRRGGEAVARLESGASRDELTHLGTAAVIDATFSVERGESFVVMGLSGSGKSTLIRMINGLWAPTAGTVWIGGRDISAMSGAELREVRRKHIAMVFQHFALLPHRTVRENAAYALQIQQVEKAERLERADHWLDVVGLGGWGDKFPGQLSGGMQQRVGLARALASEADILLMDEAFSALDPLIRREMQEQLVELQSTLSKTIIFITHDLNEAMYLGDRIAVMRAGRIVQIGTAEEILTAPADDYVASFTQDVDRTRVLTASSVMRHTEAVIGVSAGPRVAARAMEDHGTSALFVTDRSRRLLGVVTDDDVVAAAQSGTADLSGLVRTEPLETVGPDTALSELFAPSAEARVPLAVTDDDDRLLGIIPRIQLLNTMAAATGESTASRSAATTPEASAASGTADAAGASGTDPAGGSGSSAASTRATSKEA